METIDGRALALKHREKLARTLGASGVRPGLAVVLIGSDRASHLYVSLKERAAAELGMLFEKHLFAAGTPQHAVLQRIAELNARPDIHGIIVQLPVPPALDENDLIRSIDPRKDVDGFHPENIAAFMRGTPIITPSLLLSILELVDATKAPLADAPVTIVGKSPVFTDPLAEAFRRRGAHPTITHEPPTSLQNARIIVTAYGKPRWLTADRVADGAVIIDVGINELADGTIVGDASQETFNGKHGWITPVPGGVGPMTVAMLLANTVEACQRQNVPT